MHAAEKAWASNWLSQEKKNYIAGEWCKGSGKELNIINPATQEVISRISSSTKTELDKAVDCAQEVFLNKHWTSKPMRERSGLLRALGDLVRTHRAQLATLESLANGKTYKEAYYDDLPDSADIFDYYAGWIDKIYGETCPVNSGFLNYTQREPLGVCGQIVPWNFPLLMAMWKIAPALAMGNPVVIKPSEFTPLSLIYFFELVNNKLDLPKGLLNLVIGDGEVGELIARHNNIAKIAFTGSTATGKKIVQNSGSSNLKQVSLELGGKSPVIFFADTPNLEQNLSHCFAALFSHKGEKCSEPTRFLIHDKIYDQAVKYLIKKTKNYNLGDPFSEKTHQGPQCHKQHFEKILSYISVGQKEAKLLIGGDSFDNFVSPTFFEIQSGDEKIAQEEIFGPVGVIQRFSSESQALSYANNTKYGLAAGLYTQDINKAHKFAQDLQAGMIFINRYGCYDFSSPFGGFKHSGWGKEMAKHSLDLYTKTKSIWVAI